MWLHGDVTGSKTMSKQIGQVSMFSKESERDRAEGAKEAYDQFERQRALKQRRTVAERQGDWLDGLEKISDKPKYSKTIGWMQIRGGKKLHIVIFIVRTHALSAVV